MVSFGWRSGDPVRWVAVLVTASSPGALQALLGPAETGVTLGAPMTSTAAAPPFTRTSRLAQLEGLLGERILVLDGAMGTMLQRYRLTEED